MGTRRRITPKGKNMDEELELILTPAGAVDLSIFTENGKSIIMSVKGGSLEITGDADLNEAAKVFFSELLKPIVDDYIKEKLKRKT